MTTIVPTERQLALVALLAARVRAIKAIQTALDDVTRCLPRSVWIVARVCGVHGQLERYLCRRLVSRLAQLRGEQSRIVEALKRGTSRGTSQTH